MEVNHLYEGKSLTLLKGVLQHFFIYTKIFYEEVEIARSELGDGFYLLCCFFISSTTSCSEISSSWRLFPIISRKYNQGNLFLLWNKKIVVCSHLKKTLEEKVPKLCLLPSNFMRETKVVEAHLKRTMSMGSSWNRETSNTWELCYRRWCRQRGTFGWRL